MQAVLAAERRFGAERAEAFAGDEQPGTLLRRQLRPGPVDGVEQRAARLARLGLVDQVGDPGRQVGILDRHRRGVAAGEVLERIHQRRVDPAAPGRRHDEQVRPLETAFSLKVPDRQGGTGLGVGGRRQPGVRTNRFHGRTAGELLDAGHRRTLADEVAALVAKRVPRDDRARSAGPQAGGGLVHPGGGRGVAHRERVVHDVEEALQQQPGDDQVGQDRDETPARRSRRRPPDPAAEQPREPPVKAAHAAPDQHDEAEDQGRDDRRGDNEPDVVVRHPGQLADLILPVLPEPERDRKQDGQGDEEHQPRAPPRPPGTPVSESAPDPGAEYRNPVADGRRNAPDHALDEPAARKQGRREGKTAGNKRAPAPGEGDVAQPLQFPGFGPGRSRCHRRRRAACGGRTMGFDRIGVTVPHCASQKCRSLRSAVPDVLTALTMTPITASPTRG